MGGVEGLVEVIGILFYNFAPCYELGIAPARVAPASFRHRLLRESAYRTPAREPARRRRYCPTQERLDYGFAPEEAREAGFKPREVAPSRFNKVALVSSHFGMLQFLCSLNFGTGTGTEQICTRIEMPIHPLHRLWPELTENWFRSNKNARG